MTDLRPVHTEEQIADVARLAREIWEEHYVPIIGQAQVDYMLDKFQNERAISEQLAHAYEYYVIVSDGENAGYVAVVPHPGKATLMISKIYVKQAARSRGLGKEMLAFVEDLCRQRGIGKVWLTVNKNNEHSIAWYSRMGFTNAGPIVQDIGGGFVMDDFRMEKDLE